MKGIIMSAESVRAIMDGRKNQTRRVITPQPWTQHPLAEGKEVIFVEHMPGHWGFKLKGEKHLPGVLTTCLEKPSYKPGEVLYVKETWSISNGNGAYPDGYFYKADKSYHMVNWRNPMYMPRVAARIFLRVSKVRAEKVKDISENDAIAEGIEYSERGPLHWHILNLDPNGYYNYETHTEAFGEIWDKLNGKKPGCAWAYNPYVWVYEFKQISREEAESDE